MLKNYFKIAFRNLLRHKTYSFINIAGLSLGMLSLLLISVWVHNELSYDSFHENNEKLFKVVTEYNEEYWMSGSPWALAPTLKKDFPEIERYSRFKKNEAVVSYGEKKFHESVAMVDPDFLEMFSFQLIKGNASTVLDRKESVVINEKIAKKYFADEDPIGKTIRVNNNLNLTITGIINNVPLNSSLQFDILIPIANLGDNVLSSWSIESIAFIQLKENISLSNFRKKIAGTTVKYDRRVENKKMINDIQPIERMHLYSLNNIGPILYIYIFSAVALLVLIVAGINFINLATAKASIRSREISVRKVIGATKSQLVVQFLGETFLLSLFAFLFAYIIGNVLMPSFNELTDSSLKLDFIAQPWLFYMSGGIILLTTILAGSYPAFMLSSLQPIKMLRDSKVSNSNSGIRWTLVVIQFSVSIILIVLTIAMNDQMNYIQSKNLGFNKEQVLVVPLDREANKKFESIKNELTSYNNILNISRSTGAPNSLNSVNPVYWEGKGPKDYKRMSYVSVDYDYLKTFDIELAEGRSFSKDFSTDQENYIVNESAVKLMGFNSPLGKMFSIWQNEGKIIGVVKDFHSSSLHNEIQPLVITMRAFVPLNQIFIRISSNNIRETLSLIENIWTELNSSIPFQYKFMNDLFKTQYQNEQKIETLFQYLSLLAIIISCMGLFGLSAFTAETRTKEIGVRKVIGASIPSIVIMMLKDYSKWFVIAIGVASPVAYFIISKWLANFAYHIQIGPNIFIIANLIVLSIALVTVSWQAIKAATANPIDSLRNE